MVGQLEAPDSGARLEVEFLVQRTEPVQTFRHMRGEKKTDSRADPVVRGWQRKIQRKRNMICFGKV